MDSAIENWDLQLSNPAMSSSDFVNFNTEGVVVKQEIMEEIEVRGTKRSYVPVEHSGPATKIAKMEELDFPRIEVPSAGASPVSPQRVEYEVYTPRSGPSTSYMLVPAVKQESELIEAIPVVKRGRGRPKGVKNRPMSERPPKIKKRFNNVKTAFTYPHIITFALVNSPQEKATVPTLYQFIEYNFPGVPISNECWKNTLRHALMPKNGFQKQEKFVGDGLSMRDNFWTIIPERREELMNGILEKIEEHKENMEMLRMRNIDDLPAMLNGECPLPEEFRVSAKPIQCQMTRLRQNSSPEYVETRVKQENQEEEYYTEYAPQDYWIPCPMPPGAGPYYAHPYASAYHPAPYFGYPVPMYGYSGEEISNGRSPSQPIYQQQYIVIKGENPAFSKGPRSPQYPFRIENQVSTTPVQNSEPKVEEPSQ